MARAFKLKKIIWSIDAFEDKEGLQEKAARILSIFQDRMFAQIEPVFVLTATDLSLPNDYGTEWMCEFQQNLKRHLEEVLLGSGFPHVLTPKILVEPLASTSASIENLLDFAIHEKADMIIVSSHGRKGLDRFFLGSFAESLLVHSPIPVMVIGAKTSIEADIDRILLPTDFGQNSREAFRRTVTLAQEMGAKVTIFHSVPVPSSVVMDTGYYPSVNGIEGEMVNFDSFMNAQTENQEKRAKAWSDWAQAMGTECDYIIDATGENIEDQICDAAKTFSSNLIVMEGQSGPIKAALLGSVTRSVVRASPCPVLVLPTLSLEKEAELATPHNEYKTMDLGFARSTYAPKLEI